ncbi:MAG: cation transporter [Krumholzibacteria bacterium]|nr:cation transporter [Candidatus Krumholzibacteria bacterium]
MGHGHSHHPDPEQTGDRRLLAAIVVNVLLTGAQVVGGVISGSLSLVADALHNLNDAASLGIALIARRIARRPADKVRTFGYRKAEVIGALINTTTLIIVGLYLVYEAVARFLQPEPIDGWIVVIVASFALVVDLATALMTFSMAKENINIKAAFVHNVADALGSLVVICVGIVVLAFQWYVADLIATLLLAGYILFQGYRLMAESVRILMDSVPADLDRDGIAARMAAVPGVHDVHHVHIWQIDEHHRALEAHIVAQAGPEDAEAIKRALKELLRQEFAIAHTTLEFESRGVCDNESGPCA